MDTMDTIAPLLYDGTDVQDEERAAAKRRLHEALAERDRLRECYEEAIGTSSELTAYMRLRGASSEVAARDRWLRWVEEDSMAAPLAEGPTEELVSELLAGAVALYPWPQA